MSCNPPSAVAVTLDGELAVRVREKRVAEHRIAVLLAQVRSGGHHRAFGYAKLVDYAVDRHGLSPGHAKGLVQLDDRLAELPLLDLAMAEGRLDWTKARHVARIATAATEAAWIELASTSTNRALEDAVRSSHDGSVPAQVVPEDEVRLVLRMSAAEAEQVRLVLQWFRTTCGPGTEEVEDGALVAMMLQRVLADADAETAPSPDRHRFVVESRPQEESEASCDAEVVDLGTGPDRGHVTRSIPPATRRAVLHRDAHRCRVPGCSNRLWLDLHHVRPRADGGSNAERNLVTVCCVHHRMAHQHQLEISVDRGDFRFVLPAARARSR